jgi:DNA-binding CsgD family transcriptional regulator
MHGSGENLVCCWCGDVFVGDAHHKVHGSNFHPLTPREVDVAKLLAEGLSNKLIANRLGISEHTAKFHVNAILGKLGAQTRAEAVAVGVRSGLLLL